MVNGSAALGDPWHDMRDEPAPVEATRILSVAPYNANASLPEVGVKENIKEIC
jgi:hypothetical protein